jgi:hypothetical protein
VVTSFLLIDRENSIKTVKRLKTFHRLVETSVLLKRFYHCQHSTLVLYSFLDSTAKASFCCKHNDGTCSIIIVSFRCQLYPSKSFSSKIGTAFGSLQCQYQALGSNSRSTREIRTSRQEDCVFQVQSRTRSKEVRTGVFSTQDRSCDFYMSNLRDYAHAPCESMCLSQLWRLHLR